MSMHTYIGARYVPRFTGVYDPTQSYEALDVVDNGSGTSYIARIPITFEISNKNNLSIHSNKCHHISIADQ